MNIILIKRKRSCSKLLAIYLSSTLCLNYFVNPALGDDIKASKTAEVVKFLQPNMRAASDAYQDLVGLLYDEQTFRDPKNAVRIKDSLKKLQQNFHSTDKNFSVLTEDPTAIANLSALSEAIEDSAKRFEEGSLDYARWRLKTINLNCVTCHASNQSQLNSRQANAPEKATKHEQADFYLATRHFAKAKELFAQIIAGSDLSGDGSQDGIARINAVKSWLWLAVRHEIFLATNSELRVVASKAAASDLKKITQNVNLPAETNSIVQQWIQDLDLSSSDQEIDRWLNETLTENDDFSVFATNPKNFVTVLILMQRLNERLANTIIAERGSALPKKGKTSSNKIVTNSDSNSERAQIMLKLGLLSSQSYDVAWDNLPDIYFKGCIQQAPGTPSSRLCFKALQSFIEREFMGPGGAQLPNDIASSLQRFRELAEPQKVKQGV